MEENTQKLSKRQQSMLAYMNKHADIAMQSICKSFHKDIPNHLVTAGEYLERDSQLNLAKHFFELGIKAQKGEDV